MTSRASSPRPPVGFPLLAVPDDAGELHFPTLEESVRQAIQIILRTRPGEQRMRPAFGAGLESFVGEPSTLATRRRIRDTIADALARWEDRIDVERIDVVDVDNTPAEVRVEIVYRLRRTGLVQSLGLTMDLGG